MSHWFEDVCNVGGFPSAIRPGEEVEYGHLLGVCVCVCAALDYVALLVCFAP